MNRRVPDEQPEPVEPRTPRGDAELMPAGAAAPFPSEAEWLQLSPPAGLTADLPPDFVTRTLAALATERREQVLPRPQLQAFAPPPPAADFVAQTLHRLQQDRHARWRGLLARYVAPEPGPQFVTRTLRALARDRASEASAWPRRLSPQAAVWLAAAAAALLLYFGLAADRGPDPAKAPTVAVAPSPAAPTTREAPANVGPRAYAHAQSGSTLPGLLVALEHDLDPEALPAAAANGRWLAEARR